MRKFILGCGVGVAATFGIGLALGQFPGVTGTRADDAGAPASQPTISWHSGWGMGITEYLVDDGKGNQLNISCPDHEEEGFVRAYATIQGKDYSSEDHPGFDVIVDGERYSNPFFTDCRVCGDNFRSSFWDSLRAAKQLQIVVGKITVSLPTSGISEVLQPYGSPDNPCVSAQ